MRGFWIWFHLLLGVSCRRFIFVIIVVVCVMLLLLLLLFFYFFAVALNCIIPIPTFTLFFLETSLCFSIKLITFGSYILNLHFHQSPEIAGITSSGFEF